MQIITLPLVSSIAAGVLIVGQIGLMFAVIVMRRRTRQSLGDGGDARLIRAIRRHGNYAENAAIFVASLALLEMMGAPRPLVVGLAAIFIAGRFLHVIALSQAKTVNIWRVAGIVANASSCIALGFRLVSLGAAHLG